MGLLRLKERWHVEITLNIILEALQETGCLVRAYENGGRSFRCVSLPPDDGRPLDPACLYVEEHSHFAAAYPDSGGACCVRLCEAPPGPEDESGLHGHIAVCTELSVRMLYITLQELFFRINQWGETMDRYIIGNRGLDEMLSLSVPVIGNFISISDSALTLVAYTKEVEIDDPICTRLLEHGYHPDETLRMFKNTNQFEIWDKTEGQIINDVHDLSPYGLASKVFKFNNTYYSHVVMTCNNRPLSPGLLDLFQILVDKLSICITRNWERSDICSHNYDSLIIDLINGVAFSSGALQERISFLGLPSEGVLCLFVISFQSLDRVPIGRIGQELLGRFPLSRTVLYQNQIIMLNCYSPGSTEEGHTERQRQIAAFLKEYSYRCGVSSIFNELTELSIAYEQCRIALRYGARTMYGQAQAQIFTYEYDIASATVAGDPHRGRLWRQSVYAKALRKLYDHDIHKHSNNMELLRTYLMCEGVATDAADHLHMHRNNVLYRISRIEQIMGISLDTMRHRSNVLISLLYWDIYGFE